MFKQGRVSNALNKKAMKNCQILKIMRLSQHRKHKRDIYISFKMAITFKNLTLQVFILNGCIFTKLYEKDGS
jgi:hypothetical protein